MCVTCCRPKLTVWPFSDNLHYNFLVNTPQLPHINCKFLMFAMVILVSIIIVVIVILVVWSCRSWWSW